MNVTVSQSANGIFRDRDLFVHDGARMRRVRLSAPVQASFAALIAALVGWSSYATVKLAEKDAAPIVAAPAVDQKAEIAAIAAATELRAREIEQRQQVLAAMLAGEEVDPSALPTTTTAIAALPDGLDSPLDRAEAAQQEQARDTTRTIDARYRQAAAALRRLGINPSRLASQGVGGPYEPVTRADPTFKALFNSWKKLDQLQDNAIAVPSDKPVRTAAFTSGYGVRSDPFRGGAAMHAGIDLAGPLGTPIYATADGVVLNAGFNSGGYGNLIKLDHGRGIETRYGHLSSISVRPGQRVTRGQLIGRMGSTGRSTGSHLHYEVRIDGKAVNPIPFMKSTDYLVAIQRKSKMVPQDSIALGGPQR